MHVYVNHPIQKEYELGDLVINIALFKRGFPNLGVVVGYMLEKALTNDYYLYKIKWVCEDFSLDSRKWYTPLLLSAPGKEKENIEKIENGLF